MDLIRPLIRVDDEVRREAALDRLHIDVLAAQRASARRTAVDDPARRVARADVRHFFARLELDVRYKAVLTVDFIRLVRLVLELHLDAGCRRVERILNEIMQAVFACDRCPERFQRGRCHRHGSSRRRGRTRAGKQERRCQQGSCGELSLMICHPGQRSLLHEISSM